MSKKGMFDFMKDLEDEIDTSGNPEDLEDLEDLDLEDLDLGVETDETATRGNPLVHQGLTKSQVLEAQRMAESRSGLDMNKFINMTGVPGIDFEQLLSFKVE